MGQGFRVRFSGAGFWWQVSRDRFCGFSGFVIVTGQGFSSRVPIGVSGVSGFQGAGFPRGGLREAGLSRWFPIGFHRGFRWRFHGGGFCGFGGFGVSIGVSLSVPRLQEQVSGQVFEWTRFSLGHGCSENLLKGLSEVFSG